MPSLTIDQSRSRVPKADAKDGVKGPREDATVSGMVVRGRWMQTRDGKEEGELRMQQTFPVCSGRADDEAGVKGQTDVGYGLKVCERDRCPGGNEGTKCRLVERSDF